MKLTISDIIKACDGEAHVAEAELNREVTCAGLDSRIIVDGGVFIAQNGEKVDGHSFIGQVYGKGAALVITELDPDQVERRYSTPASEWGNYIKVDDSLVALKKIAKCYREKLSIPVVGITGSVGKTSTKEFIAGVLSEKYNVLKTEGNYNNEIGVPLTLLKIRQEHEVAVVEMGISDFGEMTRLSEMAQPDIAVITNIGQCHLENLKTRDGILKAKTEIFSHMKKDGRVCLFGGDDKLVTVGIVNDLEPMFFGEESPKALAAKVVDSSDNGLFGTTAKMKLNMPAKGINDTEISVNIPLPGHHMVINAAAAANVAMLLDLTPEQIKAGIENMKPIGGRNNIVRLGDITLIDDCYNANPVSMKSSIDLLGLSNDRTIVVLGDMFELGENEEELHRVVGRYAVSKGVNAIYTIGKLSENMYEAAREDWEREPKVIDEKGRTTDTICYWNSKEQFLKALEEDFSSGKREFIPAGSTILIKASHGMHFEEIVAKFKELSM